ncbi:MULTISPECIES: hypothetical protein [Mycolicibacterium]|uniref:Uncharacterized protein n=1 Tax=Mycolicibacterium vanbaalenii (strain DSM 7251 / JCM 13017 / BCRC 16820 / KCTC 9966 / NRRL B-24157 / PYR-1) TaxID=350058 RepID=A1T4Z0_MYCVP|nr:MULTISPECIES: hypothetical protein [Mycolicibacterium]ABM12240.1 conserved hypothetical protein [Mycolicibacterium vanbaalenii PYR-1]PQP43510.1 hypothetical protein C6A88_23965 [Mycolicibacterium austroafricanum]
MPMTSTDRPAPTQRQLDDIAWQFLRSEFTGEIYAQWPIDRRLDAFLLHRGHRRLHDDGSAYGALLERVMANLGDAVRTGVLGSPNAGDVS